MALDTGFDGRANELARLSAKGLDGDFARALLTQETIDFCDSFGCVRDSQELRGYEKTKVEILLADMYALILWHPKSALTVSMRKRFR